MFPYRRDDGRSAPPGAREACARLYDEHRRLLLWVGVRKFRVPEADAEGLVHDVFLAYLQTTAPVTSVRSWLVAAMCNASRQYLRRQGRAGELSPSDLVESSGDLAAEATRSLLVARLLGVVTPKAREALRLRYLAGYTFAEVGRALETTEGYAEKLVFTALARIRSWCARAERN